MFSGGRNRLARIVATVLLLGTLLSPVGMTLAAARGPMAAGHQHHHHGGHPSPLADCCEFCWTSCATAPGVPTVAVLARAVEVSYPVLTAVPANRPAPAQPSYRLPFPQGPPALLS